MNGYDLKFALISNVLPPSWSGQAVMIYRLLGGLDPEGYCLISQQNYSPALVQNNLDNRLPGKYYHLLPDLQINRGKRFGLIRFISRGNNYLAAYQRSLQIAAIVRREKCRAIIACTSDLINLPAGYYASRITGVPFYPYLFDDYVYQWVDPTWRAFSRRVEPALMKGAAGIIVPNEFMQAEIKRRYGLDAVVIYNPCDLADLERENKGSWPATKEEFRIVYTGAVYHANHDAFLNLITAIGKSGIPELKLHLYTAQSQKELVKEGIAGPVECHDHIPYAQIKEIQRKADLLFLPLAFRSAIPEVIRTSLPGKMGEYLASGRPVLAHVPSDSFVCWYLKKHQCGIIVDQDDPEALLKAILLVREDAKLREQVVTNARQRARLDYNPVVAQANLLQLLQKAGNH